MWSWLKRWFGRVDSCTEADERLFSIFDIDEASADALLGQVDTDLQAWGYDSFQSRQAGKRIVEEAMQSASGDTHKESEGREFIDAVRANDSKTLERLATELGDGVTAEDIRWYWSLHPVARAAMDYFDEELQGKMFFDLHAFNLCVRDLEQDMQRRLPVFGFKYFDHADAPLPIELKRRFILFMARTKRSPSAFEEWNLRLKGASSMNALIREMIVSGEL